MIATPPAPPAPIPTPIRPCRFGICIGMQTLFEGSEESPGIKGLGLLLKVAIAEFLLHTPHPSRVLARTK